jgi:hypothetical protein
VAATSDPLRLDGLQTDNTLSEILVADANGVVRRRSASSLVGSTGWSLLGNSGTNPSTNFIGTTDNQALVFRTNNTEKMRITSNGNVGIGTTTPGIDAGMTGGLTINGTDGTQFTIQKNAVTSLAINVSEVVNGDVQFYDRVGGTWNKAITLRSGRVGIGTEDPNSRLTVVGRALFGGNNPASIGVVQITEGDPGPPIKSRLTYGTDGNGYKFAIGKNQAGTVTDLLVIQDNGNVGIGTTTPGTDVAMTGGLTINGTAGTQFTIQKDAVTSLAINVSEVVNGDVQFYDRVGGTWNKAITLRSGRVGIGTSNPSNLLHVTATSDPLRLGGLQTDNTLSEILVADANGVVRRRSAGSLVDSTAWSLLGNSGTNPAANFLGTTDNVGLVIRTNNNERIRITNGGDVGIGTATPGGQFELSLDEGRKPLTNTWTIVSDERLKNIHGPYSKGLNEILKLNPVTYNYKNVGERTFAPEVLKTTAVGFSAQEVQKVFPEAVGVDDDGYLNFNMHAILVAYVNAIKEQQAIIEAQKMEIEMLKQKSAELDNLKAEIDFIKSQLHNDLLSIKR